MTKSFSWRGPVAGLAALASAACLAAPAVAQEEIGCTVLLCMLNPAGPYAVPFCAAAVSNYFAMAATAVALPACLAAGWAGGSPSYDPAICTEGWHAARDEGGVWGCRANMASVKRDMFGQPEPDGAGGVLYEHKFTTDPDVVTYREKAYYIDLPVDGQTRRVWF